LALGIRRQAFFCPHLESHSFAKWVKAKAIKFCTTACHEPFATGKIQPRGCAVRQESSERGHH
jgi:hypothetical protein